MVPVKLIIKKKLNFFAYGLGKSSKLRQSVNTLNTLKKYDRLK